LRDKGVSILTVDISIDIVKDRSNELGIEDLKEFQFEICNQKSEIARFVRQTEIGRFEYVWKMWKLVAWRNGNAVYGRELSLGPWRPLG
jgi:hypothetical protein